MPWYQLPPPWWVWVVLGWWTAGFHILLLVKPNTWKKIADRYYGHRASKACQELSGTPGG